MTRSSPGFPRAVLNAALVAGALDITAAVLLNLKYGARTVFQSVASGWLGAAAYKGGWQTALLGLASHFAIMAGIAAVYMTLASLQPVLRRQWIVAGILWGVVVWVVMTYVVLPLSASPLPAPTVARAIEGIVVHILMVGLPMAVVAHRMLPSSEG